MSEKSNKERLATIEEAIKHIDINLEKIANNNVNQWKAINNNCIAIAKLKTSNGIISSIVSMIVAGIISLLGWKLKQ